MEYQEFVQVLPGRLSEAEFARVYPLAEQVLCSVTAGRHEDAPERVRGQVALALCAGMELLLEREKAAGIAGVPVQEVRNTGYAEVRSQGYGAGELSAQMRLCMRRALSGTGLCGAL